MTTSATEILRLDVDGDGDPDIIERRWQGKRLRWFDENDDATAADVWGDMVHDALQVDVDDDGYYDGPSDYNVKWADRDGDGIPDIQVFNRNPRADSDWVFGKSGAVYFVSIDPGNTGMLTDINWHDLSVSWTRYHRGPNWLSNYHGNATFLKEHAPIWSVEQPEYSWENPFHFFDPDGDGLSEISLRVADDRKFFGEGNNQLRFDGIVDEAWLSFDLDNDTGRDNEMDYDLTLNVRGAPGLDYRDQVHVYPQLRAPDWVLPYYRHSAWRQQTRFVYLKRDNAVARLFGAQWQQAILTVDEDDDSHRWERVELYYPGDPYLLKRGDGNSPIRHVQSDSLGDRGEWDLDFSGEGKLYRAAWDGKIHLLGAERGAWTVDRNRAFWGAAHWNGVSSKEVAKEVGEVIQYRDSDGNGYLDTIIYDYNGDQQPERTDSLIDLGVDDRGRLLDVTTMTWDMLRLENAASAKLAWQQAQRLFRVAFRHGFVDEEIIDLSKATSVQEKYENAFWLKETILRKLLPLVSGKDRMGLLKSHYTSDIAGIERILQRLNQPLGGLPLVPGELSTLDELSSGYSGIFQLSDDDRPGAWCWFQDERVIVDDSSSSNPILLTGVVTYGAPDSEQRGDIDLYWLELNSVASDGALQRGRIELDDQLQMDDHASPSFMIRPDGRYLANWSKHGNDAILRTRISERPGDPTRWADTIRSKPTGSGITYTNPRYLSEGKDGGGQIFNGVRSRGFDSNFVLSDDLGESWRYGGRTLDANDPWPDHADGGRAYVKYAGDGKSKIHLFSTDDHPRVNFNANRTAPGPYLNSIYHAYIEGNQLHRTDGTVIDEDLSDDKATSPTEMTLLLQDGTFLGGDAMRRGWLLDVHVDADGHPFGVFQFRANDDPSDHRYFYARYDGNVWQVNFMAYGGDFFANPHEGDYTGLASVDPSNPDVVFISTSSNPITGKPLISATSGQRQQEIFMGRTYDYGRTWTWAPLTKDSPCDNLRPIVPEWTEGRSVVLWMQGNYPKFYQYDTRIVGQVIQHLVD
ncbi:BNR-4 repeat-containing protein [Coraliomargarita sp. W4R53]